MPHDIIDNRRELKRLYFRYNLRESAARHTAEAEDEPPRIVCSEALL